eukprot:scaffold4412_cov401-Prasinococcus_capsulatus_cf.AAC.14
MNRIASSPPPRSSWSPTCTTTVSLPIHRLFSSIKLAKCSALTVLPKSPWTSPIATTRGASGSVCGSGGLAKELALFVLVVL